MYETDYWHLFLYFFLVCDMSVEHIVTYDMKLNSDEFHMQWGKD